MRMMAMIGLMTMVSVACAQQDRQRPPSPEQMLEKMTEELTLSEEQVASWQAIHEKYGDEMKSNGREIRPKLEADIKEILTDEQWEKFQEMKPKRKRGKRDGR